MNDKTMMQEANLYMWLYQHVVLKVMNEAVVEGMCSVIGRHAAKGRGLSFRQYAMEAIISWHAPLPHEAGSFIRAALDEHFRGVAQEDFWNFTSYDRSNRLLTSVDSPVIDNLKKKRSKYPFIAETYDSTY